MLFRVCKDDGDFHDVAKIICCGDQAFSLKAHLVNEMDVVLRISPHQICLRVVQDRE